MWFLVNENVGVSLGKWVCRLIISSKSTILGFAQGLGQGIGDVSWEITSVAIQITHGVVESTTGSSDLGTLAAGGVGVAFVYSLPHVVAAIARVDIIHGV